MELIARDVADWHEPTPDATPEMTADSGMELDGAPWDADVETADASEVWTEAGQSSADAGSDGGAADAGRTCVYGEFGAPVPLTGLQITGSAWGTSLSGDALTLYFGETVGTDERILRATRMDRGTVFSPAVEVPNVQSASSNGTPAVTRDDLSLYFYSDRMGGLGGRDIWLATRASASEEFSTPTLVANVNTVASDQHAVLSADGLTLFFSSNRGGGFGGHDVWNATRPTTSATFSTPTNLAELNSSEEDASPAISDDELTIVFVSEREGGVGAKDLWMATRSRKDEPFGAPVNLTAVNSTTADTDCALSSDGTELVFSSPRDTTRSLWRSTRSCD